MLVLTRRPREAIRVTVGSEVVMIYLVEIGQGKVRIGIEASRSVIVDREEVALAKEEKLPKRVSNGENDNHCG